jgi:hypothetical protein
VAGTGSGVAALRDLGMFDGAARAVLALIADDDHCL